MPDTFIKHALRPDAILDIRLFEFKKTECLIFCKLTHKITVKCLNNFVVGNATDNEVKIRIVLSGTAFGYEPKPFFIIFFKI